MGKHHPNFTTFKYRKKEGWIKKTVDYIFMCTNEYYNMNGCTIQSIMDPGDLAKDNLINTQIGNPC